MAALALSSAVEATLREDAPLRCILLVDDMKVGGVKAVAAPRAAAAAMSTAAVRLGRGIFILCYF